MTDAELREIEAREKAATPGPWMTEDPDDDALDNRPAVVGEKRRTGVGTERPIIVNDTWAPDAVFIAAARQDIPALCAEVRQLGGVVRSLLDEIERLRADLARVRGVLREVLDAEGWPAFGDAPSLTIAEMLDGPRAELRARAEAEVPK